MRENLNRFIKFLMPPNQLSWDMFLWLGIFSWLIGLPASPIIQRILSIFGCVFLILSIAWLTETQRRKMTILGIFLGSWISGALTCAFLALFWGNQVSPGLAAILWPLVSTAFITIPVFVKAGPRLSIPTLQDRQRLVILILSNIVISFWIRFHFSIQTWLEMYPSLLTDSVGNSAFVTAVGPRGELRSSGGAVLDLVEVSVRKEIQGLSWSDVEKWLDSDTRLTSITLNALQTFAAERKNLKEFSQQFWSFGVQKSWKELPEGNGYELELFAVWAGPSSQSEGYYFTKSCQISQKQEGFGLNPANLESGGETEMVGDISCQSIKGPEFGWKKPSLLYLRREKIVM